MCGIAGYYHSDDEDAVKRMLDAQKHRGPDDWGVWLGPGMALGHRRLAILDPSQAGHQPMADVTQRLHIVFNGEIYNYRALRETLKHKGYSFSTQTDTEVVLAAYHAWGVQAIVRLVGMFAFALVDLQPPAGAPDMLLVRDRLGIKPLLYATAGPQVWFASELQGLAASGALPGGVDAAALVDYLNTGAVDQPKTMLRGASALMPGCYLALRGHTRRLVRYWHLHTETHDLRAALRDVSSADAAERLRALLEEATAAHLLADVPVGAFLSGGVDSAAVAGLMAPRMGQQLRTYAIGFAGPHARLDERSAARASAAFIGTQHQECAIQDGDAANLFASVVHSINQPSLDGTNTFLAARLARQDVTVALSGLGADEILGGYAHFNWLMHRPREGMLRRQALCLLQRSLWNAWPHWRITRGLFQRSSLDDAVRLLRRLLADGPFFRAVQPRWHPLARQRQHAVLPALPSTGSDDLQRLSFAETQGYLVNTLLRDADAMSMAHSLELRPVFLHHPLVEFAYALPQHHKVHGGRGKRVLLQALSDVLPPQVHAAPKRGFEMPMRAWMATDGLRPRLMHLLHTPNARRIFRQSYRQHLRATLALKRPAHALWAWGVLLGWLEEHRLSL